jgi:hypothetical protein
MAKKRQKPGSLVPAPAPLDTAQLLADLRGLIDAARAHVAQAVNAGMVLLYWSVGDRLRREVIGEGRAAYGEQIMQTVSAQLTAEYGRGFSRFALSRMVKFAELFPNREIVAVLSQQLGWSHFIEIIPLEESPEGSRLVIREEPPGDIPFLTEEEQGDDPAAVQQWIDELRALPPLPMTSEQEAELLAWRRTMKEFNVEAVRRPMEAG